MITISSPDCLAKVIFVKEVLMTVPFTTVRNLSNDGAECSGRDGPIPETGQGVGSPVWLLSFGLIGVALAAGRQRGNDPRVFTAGSISFPLFKCQHCGCWIIDFNLN